MPIKVRAGNAVEIVPNRLRLRRKQNLHILFQLAGAGKLNDELGRLTVLVTVPIPHNVSCHITMTIKSNGCRMFLEYKHHERYRVYILN